MGLEGNGSRNTWLSATIDTESKLLLEVDVFSRHGTDPAAAFPQRLTENHDVADTKFLVDAGGYLTALACHDLSGHLVSHDRNHIEKWFQTVTMRSTAFTRVGGAVSHLRDGGYVDSDTTTTVTDRIER
jgi:transposase-like protein